MKLVGNLIAVGAVLAAWSSVEVSVSSLFVLAVLSLAFVGIGLSSRPGLRHCPVRVNDKARR